MKHAENTSAAPSTPAHARRMGRAAATLALGASLALLVPTAALAGEASSISAAPDTSVADTTSTDTSSDTTSTDTSVVDSSSSTTSSDSSSSSSSSSTTTTDSSSSSTTSVCGSSSSSGATSSCGGTTTVYDDTATVLDVDTPKLGGGELIDTLPSDKAPAVGGGGELPYTGASTWSVFGLGSMVLLLGLLTIDLVGGRKAGTTAARGIDRMRSTLAR